MRYFISQDSKVVNCCPLAISAKFVSRATNLGRKPFDDLASNTDDSANGRSRCHYWSRSHYHAADCGPCSRCRTAPGSHSSADSGTGRVCHSHVSDCASNCSSHANGLARRCSPETLYGFLRKCTSSEHCFSCRDSALANSRPSYNPTCCLCCMHGNSSGSPHMFQKLFPDFRFQEICGCRSANSFRTRDGCSSRFSGSHR